MFAIYVSFSLEETILVVVFKASIIKVVVLQPSVVTGSFVGDGLGCPKPIHNAKDIPITKPVKAP